MGPQDAVGGPPVLGNRRLSVGACRHIANIAGFRKRAGGKELMTGSRPMNHT